jgi:hypothetical protein
MPNAMDVTATSEYLKVAIVGEPGTGKSVFASTFPTPGFVFDFSGGIITYRGKDFDYEQYQTSPSGWDKFQKDFREVKKGVDDGKYQSVILDDCTTMTDLAMEKSMSLDPKRSPTGGPIWNIHYMMVRNLMEGSLRRFVELPCNLVIIAHVELDKDEETGAILGAHPMLTGQLAIRMPGYFDEVYYTSVRKEGDKVKWLVQTVPIGVKMARSRLSGKEGLLPYFIPNDYPSLMAYARKAQKTKTEEITNGSEKK